MDGEALTVFLAAKVGRLVRNERQRRWGQVVWDAKKWQFESGQPMRILVWDVERRGTIDWPLGDVSVVVANGKVVWEDPGMAARLDGEWREVVRREPKDEEVVAWG